MNLSRFITGAFNQSRCFSTKLQLSYTLGSLHQTTCTSKSSRNVSSTSDEVNYKNIDVMNVDKVRVIGLNRPRHRNAVNSQTAQELYQAFCQFDEDESVNVAVLYGKGGCFCAGYDLKEVAGALQSGRGFNLEKFFKKYAVENDIGPMGPSRLLLSKPVIAAVSGHAVAGGLELALLCDMRVVEEDAIFGVFCRRFGVPLTDGGTVRLPALIGLSSAMDMILTGRPVGAQEALQMGLANRVVPRGNSLNEALILANQIAAFPQECMKLDRKSAYHSMYSPKSHNEENWLREALAYEYSQGVKVLEKESIPGAQKFEAGAGRGGQF